MLQELYFAYYGELPLSHGMKVLGGVHFDML